MTPRDGIYIASKTTHGARWREMRASGLPVISTWIDEAEQGATSNWPDLWSRCISEASSCGALVVYREGDEVLKGAWAEVGAAISAGVTVYAVGCDDFSIKHHPLFIRMPTLESALENALCHIEEAHHDAD